MSVRITLEMPDPNLTVEEWQEICRKLSEELGYEIQLGTIKTYAFIAVNPDDERT